MNGKYEMYNKFQFIIKVKHSEKNNMEASSTYPEPKSNLFYKTPSIYVSSQTHCYILPKAGRFKRCDNIILCAIEWYAITAPTTTFKVCCFDVLLFYKMLVMLM